MSEAPESFRGERICWWHHIFPGDSQLGAPFASPCRLPTKVVPVNLLAVACFQTAGSAGAGARDGNSTCSEAATGPECEAADHQPSVLICRSHCTAHIGWYIWCLDELIISCSELTEWNIALGRMGERESSNRCPNLPEWGIKCNALGSHKTLT